MTSNFGARKNWMSTSIFYLFWVSSLSIIRYFAELRVLISNGGTLKYNFSFLKICSSVSFPDQYDVFDPDCRMR